MGLLPDKYRWLSEWVTGVRSCYDEGKRTAETLTMDYHRGAGVEVTDSNIYSRYFFLGDFFLLKFSCNCDMVMQVRIARIFNTYGPRMCIDDGRVVSNFVAQVGKLSFVVKIGRNHCLICG